MGKNEESIKEHKIDIGKNTKNIDKHKKEADAAFKQLTEDQNHLIKQNKAIENVGKVSVSVAVGAYGSKSAIAVGAGYRVNPHLAFKGGAAINTSGSRKGSYNLGINYEF